MTRQQQFLLGLVTGTAAAFIGGRLARSRHAIDFAGRSVVITGGSRGLGLVIARQLAAEGARLCLLARDAGELIRARDELDSLGADVMIVRCDIRRRADVRACVDQILDRWTAVDVLINNAGVIQVGPLEHMTEEDFENAMATHFWGPLHLMLELIPSMRRRGFGRIVNIGSINGQAGQYGQVNYAAAKSGIHGFTKALAQEGAAKGITVNAIAPGYIDTDMVRAVPPPVLEKIVAKIPVGRLGKAEEIARGVLFLVADEGGFITGSTLSINGGQHMY
jgi:acetoacetyl-CoA reductase